MKTLANIISTLGNPLAIGLFFGFYFHFTHEEPETLKNLPLLFSLVLILPMVAFIAYNVFTGNFADFDVSNRKKRNSVYKLLIILLPLLSVIIYIYDFPLKALLLSLTLFVHITTSYIINQKVKVSMHTSFCFLFAYIFYPINPSIALCLFGFGFINAWSRVYLKRHTFQEVTYGFVLGNGVGIVYLLAFYYFL